MIIGKYHVPLHKNDFKTKKTLAMIEPKLMLKSPKIVNSSFELKLKCVLFVMFTNVTEMLSFENDFQNVM